MNKNLTDIIIILDRSGSMQHVAGDMVGGLEKFFADQKAAQLGDVRVTFVQFDTEYETLYTRKPLSNVPAPHLNPRGATALLDAIGLTIDKLGETYAKAPEEERPAKVLVLIVTDGYENASKVYSRDRVFSMIKHQREVYSWDFVFLGANQDAIASGRDLGISMGKSMTYTSTQDGVGAMFTAASSYTARTRAAPDAVLAAAANAFTMEERQAQLDAAQKQEGAK